MKAICIQGLTKFMAHLRFSGIDLELAQGELLALARPRAAAVDHPANACRLRPADAARYGSAIARVSGAGVMVPPERQYLAGVQNYAVWPHMTVFENVAYGLQVRKVARTELLRSGSNARVDTVRLTALAQRYPSELSGDSSSGLRWRALVSSPTSSPAGRPLSNLDAHLREEMRTRSARCTIFWA